MKKLLLIICIFALMIGNNVFAEGISKNPSIICVGNFKFVILKYETKVLNSKGFAIKGIKTGADIVQLFQVVNMNGEYVVIPVLCQEIKLKK